MARSTAGTERVRPEGDRHRRSVAKMLDDLAAEHARAWIEGDRRRWVPLPEDIEPA